MSFSQRFAPFFRPGLAGVAVVLLGLAAGCTYSHGDPAPACDAATQTITYTTIIAPILAGHCLQCHGSTVYATQGSGYDFSNYLNVKNYSSSRLLGCIRQEPGYPAMPQSGDKLSDCDIERIQRWITLGKPE